MPKRSSATILVLAIALTSPARAESGGKDACVEAHLSAQRSRKNGQVIEAREALRVCARPECPQMLVADCGSWLAEVDRAIPSIVVRARTTAGE